MTIEQVATKYHNIYHETTLENTILSFSHIPENIITRGDMSVIFLRLTDTTFEAIKANPMLMMEPSYMLACFSERGPNIHLTKIFGKCFRGFRDVTNSLIAIHKPSTLTWFRDDFNKLHSVKVGG